MEEEGEKDQEKEEEEDEEHKEEGEEEEDEEEDTKLRIWFLNYSCHFQVLRTKKCFCTTCMLRIHVSVSSAASLLGCI